MKRPAHEGAGEGVRRDYHKRTAPQTAPTRRIARHPDTTPSRNHVQHAVGSAQLDSITSGHCPWPCLDQHITLADATGRPQATLCLLCGQALTRADWRAELEAAMARSEQ